MIGAVNIMASKRSKMPPWPGRMLPESLTCTERLNMDSTKSPHVPIVATIAAATMLKIMPAWKKKSPQKAHIIQPATIVRMTPPTKPSMVFLGEMRS